MKFNRLIAFSLCIFMFSSCASRDVIGEATGNGAADIDKNTAVSSVVISVEAVTDETQAIETSDIDDTATADTVAVDTSDTMTAETESDDTVALQESTELSGETVHSYKTEASPENVETLAKVESVLDVETGITFVETGRRDDEEETVITASLVNDSLTDTVNGYYLDMDSYPQFTDATFIVMKFPSGAIIKMEWNDKKDNETKRTVYLPVTMSSDDDVTPTSVLWELQPKELIECVVHCYK